MNKYIKTILLSTAFFCGSVSGAMAQVYWGYSDNTVASGMGMGQNSTVSGAIYIPAEVAEIYKGNTVTSVRIGLNNAVTELKAFVTKSLDDLSQCETAFGAQKAGTASFTLDEGYVIDGEGFYVGYSCVGTNAVGRSKIYNPNGCWVKDGDGEWIDYAGNEDFKYNALNIAAGIDGSNMPFDARIIVDSETMVGQNEGFELPVKLENLSKEVIKKYEVKYSIDNGEEQTISKVGYVASNSTAKFYIEVPGFAEFGVHDVNISLVSVNGGDDDYAGNNSVDAKIKVTQNTFVKRVVVEEGTGSWCGWCPRGIVAFDYMHEKYPDTFIGIAAHYNDEMSISAYDPLFSFFDAYPNSIANRDPSKIQSPTSASLEGVYKNIIASKAVVDLTVKANIAEGSNAIDIETDMIFAYSEKGAEYRLSFVVLEDSVEGYQNNNFSGGASGEMGGFENLPQSAEIKFNHVARGLYDYDGIEGSVPADLTENEIYEYKTTVDLPKVKRKTYLSVVAMVINGKTNLIENAAKCKVTLGAGVEGNSEDNFSVYVNAEGNVVCSESDGQLEVFNLNGVMVPQNNLSRGVYVVRYTYPSGVTVVRKIVY